MTDDVIGSSLPHCTSVEARLNSKTWELISKVAGYTCTLVEWSRSQTLGTVHTLLACVYCTKSMGAAQYVLPFLVLAVNSAWF